MASGHASLEDLPAAAATRRFGADDAVLEYSELVARADTRVEYRYTYRS
jgi:hypothetical protein